MLISPTEPKKLKALGTVSSKPEKYGADILVLGNKKRIGVQRKQFPGDLLASLNDGRLYDQLPRLMDLDMALLIIEGHGRWTEDGELIADQWHTFTMQQLNGLLFTVMFEFGIPTMWVRDMAGTVDALVHLDKWAQKTKHTSLGRRPTPSKSSWGSATKRHTLQHIMQGFPGIGADASANIIEHFGMAPLTFTHSIDELMEVPGIGQKRAQGMYDALEVVVDGT